MVDAIAALLRSLRAGTSSLEEDGAFLTMGIASGGFQFCERAEPVHNVSRMSRTDMQRVPRAVSVTDTREVLSRSQSCGRETAARVGQARFAARCAAAANSNSVFTARNGAVALVKRVCSAGKRLPEFDALRSSVLSGEQLHQAAESLILISRTHSQT